VFSQVAIVQSPKGEQESPLSSLEAGFTGLVFNVLVTDGTPARPLGQYGLLL
jgi:hypothetical protein